MRAPWCWNMQTYKTWVIFLGFLCRFAYSSTMVRIWVWIIDVPFPLVGWLIEGAVYPQLQQATDDRWYTGIPVTGPSIFTKRTLWVWIFKDDQIMQKRRHSACLSFRPLQMPSRAALQGSCSFRDLGHRCGHIFFWWGLNHETWRFHGMLYISWQ